MVKKFNELFENKSNDIWDISEYDTIYEVNIKMQLKSVLNEFKTWCVKENFQPSSDMINYILKSVSDNILYINWELKDLYDFDDEETYFIDILEGKYKVDIDLFKKTKEYDV